MATIQNEITINAPIDRIWEALSNIRELEKYDPTVEKCTALSESKNGIGAKRKVTLKDGKNWFEEKCTVSKLNKALKYELISCSFPIQNLNHSYTFERNGSRTTVKQVMDYKVKFGFFGKIIDYLVMRKQSDKGIKLFLDGLKSYTEN